MGRRQTNRTHKAQARIASQPASHSYPYLDGVDDGGRHAQAQQPLDGARAVHVVLLHEGAMWWWVLFYI